MKQLKYILLLSFFLFGLGMYAQQNLEIEAVFDEFGKQQGSILIELEKDVLGENTRIAKYKSLVIKKQDNVLEAILEAIEVDIEGGLKLVETKKDGRIESGRYCLSREKDSKTYEYVLFKNEPKRLTLVYLRGNFPPERLERELKKLQNLFIQVNNKQIKLSQV
ncbi:hypothetical protein LJB98_01565 [Bacteroidales bacterium OttesenSCG-928-M11]|nr:hypothetical protein [Bacteroidales bacterium OttesenSCG-928-M11]